MDETSKEIQRRRKSPHISGKPEASLLVKIYVCIFTKTYLTVSKNGFRLALWITACNNNCTQLIARLDFCL